MKLALTSFFAFVLLIVSCKKDNESSELAISGEYKVYRLVVEDPNDGPLEYPVPTPDGDYSKAIIKANKDSSMSLNISYYNKQNQITDKIELTGRVVKIGTGNVRIMSGNNWLGTFLQNNEVELYPDATSTLYAKK